MVLLALPVGAVTGLPPPGHRGLTHSDPSHGEEDSGSDPVDGRLASADVPLRSVILQSQSRSASIHHTRSHACRALQELHSCVAPQPR